MRAVAVDVLLALTVLSELICVVGVLASATVFERLHYSGSTSSVGPFLLLAAVAIRQGHAYNPVWNALFDAVVLFTLNAALSHGIARVSRQRLHEDVKL